MPFHSKRSKSYIKRWWLCKPQELLTDASEVGQLFMPASHVWNSDAVTLGMMALACCVYTLQAGFPPPRVLGLSVMQQSFTSCWDEAIDNRVGMRDKNAVCIREIIITAASGGSAVSSGYRRWLFRTASPHQELHRCRGRRSVYWPRGKTVH